MSYSDAAYPLIANGAATGSAVAWPGGKGAFAVYAGTFNGATVKLQWTPDQGVTWLDVDRSGDTYTTLTAVGAGQFLLPICQIRAFVSGGPPSGINAAAEGIA